MKTFMHLTRFWHVRMLKLKPKEKRTAAKNCKVCGKTFETKSNLKDHMLMNHNEKLAYIVCGKTFKTRVQSKGSYVKVSSKL